MTFDPAQYLTEHNGDAHAALTALSRELDEQRGGRDREGQAAARARRERDEARARAQQLEEDAARQLTELEQARARIPAEGAVVLTADALTAYREFETRGGLTAWDADRTAAQEGVRDRQSALSARLALQNGWNPERLSRLVGTRQLEEREIQVDGQAQRVIGLASGETFTPATQEFADFAASLTVAPTQTVNPSVTFVRQPSATTTNPPADPVQAYLDQRRQAAQTPHNPLTATPNRS